MASRHTITKAEIFHRNSAEFFSKQMILLYNPTMDKNEQYISRSMFWSCGQIAISCPDLVFVHSPLEFMCLHT